jgi:hypothetical protein
MSALKASLDAVRERTGEDGGAPAKKRKPATKQAAGKKPAAKKAPAKKAPSKRATAKR